MTNAIKYHPKMPKALTNTPGFLYALIEDELTSFGYKRYTAKACPDVYQSIERMFWQTFNVPTGELPGNFAGEMSKKLREANLNPAKPENLEQLKKSFETFFSVVSDYLYEIDKNNP
jgi:hypothetical protein